LSPYLIGEFPSTISISNTWTATKLFINGELPEIIQLKKKGLQ
jgi:hypothetical protein